jgi:hypothetical protein
LEVKSVKILDIRKTKPMTNFVQSNICLKHFLSRKVCNTTLLQYHWSSAMFLEKASRKIRDSKKELEYIRYWLI